jgi:hypothetical protein
MHTVLVLSGSTTAEQAALLEGVERPEVVLPSVAALRAWLARAQQP